MSQFYHRQDIYLKKQFCTITKDSHALLGADTVIEWNLKIT